MSFEIGDYQYEIWTVLSTWNYNNNSNWHMEIFTVNMTAKNLSMVGGVKRKYVIFIFSHMYPKIKTIGRTKL